MLAIYTVLYLLGILGDFLYILCASILYLYALPLIVLGRILHLISPHITRCIKDSWLMLWLLICITHLYIFVVLGASE